MRVAAIFSDHMVLQRDIPIPVWGQAAPGQRVSVELAGHTRSASADANGRWLVQLPPLAAGGPLEMRIEGTNSLLLRDVMVGEVWLCSGQSNMEFPLALAQDVQEVIAAARNPQIRFFNVSHSAKLEPQQDTKGAWSRCVPETASNFSAVGYFFGRELSRKLNLPVGLINSSWGGTRAESWTPRAALLADDFYKQMVREYENELRHPSTASLKLRAQYQQWKQKHSCIKDTCNEGEAWGWAKPEMSTDDWQEMDLPRNWQSAGHKYSGIFWFRKTVEIPTAWAGHNLQLNLGALDKYDVTYFNGVPVGSLSMEQRPDAWCLPREYVVPGQLVRPGRNVIAVRVFSNHSEGGFISKPDQMNLMLVDELGAAASSAPLDLAGLWRYKIERNFGLIKPPPAAPEPPGEGNPNSPYMLFNNMIYPLLPYAIRGVIWYQGESNSNLARQYRRLFPLLIGSWRAAWRQGDFPFLFVQLASFMPAQNEPGESQSAELREAQSLALALPNTGMAVAIDIGQADDIHPRNKKDVGLRLALPALAQVYGFKDLVYSGPLYRSQQIKEDTIHLEFNHVGAGLNSRGGKLRGFAIAGADRQFVWADARIVGDSVVVSSSRVPRPVAVRYCWADNPNGNLYNSAGLPAAPFRSDVWPGITA